MENRERYESLLVPQLDALYRTALRMIGDAASAQDLVRETALRAYGGFGRFDAGSIFRAWIFRILTNTLIDEYRRRGARPSLRISRTTIPQPESARLSRGEVRALAERVGDEASRARPRSPAVRRK